jgi:hypothetical protein
MTEPASGRTLNVHYESLISLSAELAATSKNVLEVRTTVVESLNQLPAQAFGLAAESNTAYMAYRKRVGALSSEVEAFEMELLGMSEALEEAAAAYKAESAAAAGSFGAVQRQLDQPQATPSAPATPLKLDWDMQKNNR